MPFHDLTELPAGFCAPKTALARELSVEDRVQITELLHRVYLFEPLPQIRLTSLRLG